MEDPILKEAQKEAEQIWKDKLEKDFNVHIQKCLTETLKSLQVELNKFDESMKNHIKSLDKDFTTKFNQQKSQIEKQLSEAQDINYKNPFYFNKGQ